MNILKTMKKMAVGAITTGFTITLAACYGPMDEGTDWNPTGRVTDGTTGAGIPNMQVCAVQQTYNYCVQTDENGYYQFDYDLNSDIHYDDYQVCVEDTDGAENGTYAGECQDVAAYTEYPQVNFSLDEIVE